MGFASNVTRGKHSINAYESYELRVIYVAVRAMRVRWSCDGRAMVVRWSWEEDTIFWQSASQFQQSFGLNPFEQG